MPPKPPPPSPPKPRIKHKPPPPPHERAKKTRPKRILLSVIIGTAVAFALGLIMHFLQIPVNVILPVLAPIWVGVTTIAFTELREH